MKNMLFLLAALSISNVVNAQKISEKDLYGCWQIMEMKSDDGKEISINDLNGPGIFTTCFLEKGKFVSTVENEGKSSEMGTGTFSISEDGKTIRQKMYLEETSEFSEESEMSIEITDSKIIKLKGDGMTMILQKKL